MESISFPLLIFIAVASAILLVLVIVLDIIAIINRKKSSIITFSFLSFLFLFTIAASLIFMVKKTKSFFKDTISANSQKMIENFPPFKETSIEYDKQLYRDSIKKFSENYKDIDSNFFNSYGKEEWYRVPLVYPYSLNMFNELKYASIKNDKKTDYNKAEYDVNILENISYAAFNDKFMLCRVERVINSPPDENKTNPDYIIFNFKTAKHEKYTNFKAMLNAAKKMGYTGREDLIPVSEIYYQWF